MAGDKRHALLVAALIVAALALAAEGWWWWRGTERAQQALLALRQKTQERDRLAAQTPALDAANETAIAADVAAVQTRIAGLRAELAGRDATLLATQVPAKSTDVYFNLATFAERTRALAARAQVVVKAEESFGFASHANEGPETELIPAVFRQRLLAQHLIEALLEARPRALLSVQRELPLDAAARAARNQPVDPDAPESAPGPMTRTRDVSSGGVAADFFEFDPALSVRVPGVVDSEAFRVEFTGQTPALRAWLNTLAESRVPVLVRSVEVEPLRAENARLETSAEPEANVPVPLVTQNFSKFAVVVEFLLLVPAPAPAAP